MGEWNVRVRAFGVGSAWDTHTVINACSPLATRPCYPVVGQHQQIPEETEMQAASITTGYARAPGLGATGSWYYQATWTTPTGKTWVLKDTGFGTREAAERAAEARLDAVAKAALPEETYPYTPKVD